MLSAVLSTALDLVDLSETTERRWSWDRRSPRGSRKEGRSRRGSPRRKKPEPDETELIQVETEQLSPGPGPLNPERMSLDSGAASGLRNGLYHTVVRCLCPAVTIKRVISMLTIHREQFCFALLR